MKTRMDKSNVLAGVVLYKSKMERVLECINALHVQVSNIVVFDNSPDILDSKYLTIIVDEYKCDYIHSTDNVGMPEALNRIMEIADNRGFEWVLTMDHDSIVPFDIIENYSKYFREKEVGIICPQVIDRRRKYMIVSQVPINKKVKMCITSGSCVRVEAWKQVGKFDGWLFVDLLDNDLCKRMILNGWKILQVGSVVLDHEFGDIEPKDSWEEMFWIGLSKAIKIRNVAKLSYKKNVHPERVYYTCRNILYLNKKYAKYGGIGYESNYNCRTFAGFVICFIIPSILRGNDKRTIINAAKKGIEEGQNKAKEIEPWVADPVK